MQPALRSDGRRRGLRVGVLALGFALAACVGPAAAQKVGVAAAVNPDAFTSRGGQLNIGKSIFFNERISTTGSGLVQVLLVDGSTFTVGPGSNLVIDKFVYNPKKETGEVVATFSKGAIRYVGGKISKNQDGVTIKTPNGSLAVRGGMVQGIVSGKTVLFSFLYGREMVFTAKNGQTYKVFQPGYTLDLSGGIPTVRPTTAADIAKVVAQLTNSDTSAVGSSDDEEGEGPDAVSQLANISNDIADLIDEFTANQIQAALLLQWFEPEPTPSTPPPPPIPDNLSGYAAAISIDDDGWDANQLIGLSPSDFALFFNGATGSAQMMLHNPEPNESGPGTYQLAVPIGATSIAGFPGHIGTMEATVVGSGGYPYQQSSASGAFFVGNPDGGPVLCSKCDFMRWGFVEAEVTYTNDPPYESQSTIVGFWVAGDLPTVGQLPTSGSATYTGHTIGIVAHRADYYAAWATRAAAGNVNMNWNFASRTGNLAITNFDGARNFSGTMNMSGPNSAVNRFHGSLAGSGLTGSANGSFARRGSDPAAGVIGNWAARNGDTYRATGIFGAAR